jgi:hypothetical protein
LRSNTVKAENIVKHDGKSAAKEFEKEKQDPEKKPTGQITLNVRPDISRMTPRNFRRCPTNLLDSAGVKLPPPAKKTTDLEGKADQRGSSESHPGAGRMPSTVFSRDQSAPEAFRQQTVGPPRIGLCARMRQMLFVVLLPNGMGS